MFPSVILMKGLLSVNENFIGRSIKSISYLSEIGYKNIGLFTSHFSTSSAADSPSDKDFPGLIFDPLQEAPS